MAKLLFWLNQAPDTAPHARVAFELAKAATEKGHQVSLFLLDDGVYNAAKAPLKLVGHAPPGLVQDLAAWTPDGPGGLEVLACTLSCEERGLEATDLWPGARISASSALGALLKVADRTLAFIP